MAAADEAASSASPCRSLETLERELAVTLGTEYAIVTGSGRSALEIALRSLTDRGAGGTVLCSNFTCAIVPQTIAKSGLRAALVDISEDLSFNVDSIRELPADCRGMVLNYLYGCPIDNLERVRDFVRRHGLFLIEDVAQSFGASLNGAPAGSAGDMGVFSFTKVFFDLPRGGCLVTNRSELATRARAVRSQIEAPFPTEAVRMAYRLTDAVGWRLGRLKERVWPAPDPFTRYQGRPYTYFEESHPSTYWALSRDEADSCLSTLRALDSAKRERSRLVKTMIQRIDADLGGLFSLPAPYSPEFVYSKVPLTCSRFERSTLKPLMRAAGIHTGMDYIPLHNNAALRGTFTAVSGNEGYGVSEYSARHLLPLPVGADVPALLQEALRHLL